MGTEDQGWQWPIRSSPPCLSRLTTGFWVGSGFDVFGAVGLDFPASKVMRDLTSSKVVLILESQESPVNVIREPLRTPSPR